MVDINALENWGIANQVRKINQDLEDRFNNSIGHDHDGSDSKLIHKIAMGEPDPLEDGDIWIDDATGELKWFDGAVTRIATASQGG